MTLSRLSLTDSQRLPTFYLLRRSIQWPLMQHYTLLYSQFARCSKNYRSLGTKLLHSSAYHPQTSGQTERVNQILEDMLRACVLEFPQKWDECLPLAEFSYNNSYQESIKMASFEALYGRRCRTLLNWSEPSERYFFRPDMVKETEEKVQKIIHNMKKAQARQKSYADKR
jgi:hypothetical protein